MPVSRKYRGMSVNNLVMKYREGHKWHFLHEQQRNEGIIFMHFDSESKKDVIRHVGYSAFRVQGTFDFHPRESIEFRAMSVY
jgi:hypothetical protein